MTDEMTAQTMAEDDGWVTAYSSAPVEMRSPFPERGTPHAFRPAQDGYHCAQSLLWVGGGGGGNCWEPRDATVHWGPNLGGPNQGHHGGAGR